MTPKLLVCVFCLTLVALNTWPLSGAEPGGQSKLIPASFDGDGGSTGKYTKVKRTAFQRMMDVAKPPRLVPKKKGPSFFDKVGRNTKRIANKTKSSFSNPLKLFRGPGKSKSKYVRSRGGSKRVSRESWFSKLFASRKSADAPSTVTGFLGQDRLE